MKRKQQTTIACWNLKLICANFLSAGHWVLWANMAAAPTSFWLLSAFSDDMKILFKINSVYKTRLSIAFGVVWTFQTLIRGSAQPTHVQMCFLEQLLGTCGLSIKDTRRCMAVQRAWAISGSENKVDHECQFAFGVTFSDAGKKLCADHPYKCKHVSYTYVCSTTVGKLVACQSKMQAWMPVQRAYASAKSVGYRRIKWKKVDHEKWC